MGFSLLNNFEYKDSYTTIHFKDSDGYGYSLSFQAITALKRKGYKPNKFSEKNEYVYDNIKLWINQNNFPFSYCSGKFINAHERNLLFVCDECKNTWSTSWSNIMAGQLCPSKSCRKNRASERGRIKFLSEDNSLQTLYPEISKEWDYDKNSLSPSDYCSMSDSKVYWICLICGNSYYSSIKNRSLGCGCPKCKLSKGEKRIHSFLDDSKIAFIPQKRFEDCRNTYALPFDFYLPDYNLCIEYHGEQHYKSNNYFGGDAGLKYRKNNDNIKEEYCKNKNINLLIIPYFQYDNIENILLNYFKEDI